MRILRYHKVLWNRICWKAVTSGVLQRMKMLIWMILLASLAFAKAQECGEDIGGSSGYITSPGFPDHYPRYFDCRWRILAEPPKKTHLEFLSFNLEACECCDQVTISSVDENGRSAEIGRYCRSEIPSPITSESTLIIKFTTDGHISNNGFKLLFTKIDKPGKEGQARRTSQVPSHQEPSNKTNTQWLLDHMKKRKGLDIPRATLALFLVEPELFQSENNAISEVRDGLTIRVLAHLTRNQTIPTHDLALYLQALMVTCQDPRDFYGHDLVSELRAKVDQSSTFINPFEILALCNAGGPVYTRDVETVSAAFDSQHRPFWTDVQAIATMAMQCLSSHVTVDERAIDDMKDELKKRQFRNGTVENIVTTALVVQALKQNGSTVEFFDLPSALDVLVRAQEEDGSWGRSIRNSFYILPAISKKSFLDINDKHCPKTTETEEESLARLQEAGGDKFVVQYSVWIGNDVELGRTWRIRVQSNRNTSFYDVIEMVSKLDNRHNVTYQVVDRKPYVRSLLGKEDDPESGIFWFTYVRSSSSKEPPTLVESSPADVSVIQNQELILWYKSNDWNGNSTPVALSD